MTESRLKELELEQLINTRETLPVEPHDNAANCRISGCRNLNHGRSSLCVEHILIGREQLKALLPSLRGHA